MAERTLVKICGLRDVTAARAALDAGADFVGFVLAPSRRQLTPEQVRSIVAALPAGSPTVGVFVNESAAVVNRVVERCLLAYAQLSGDEPPEVVAAVRAPVLKALRVPRPGSAGPSPAIEEAMAAYRSIVSAFLLDAYDPTAYGGTGQTCDWHLAAQLSRYNPTFLAGGLTPENVGQAVRVVRPFGVDVSSGVEVDGQKDPARIAAFVEAVRRADEGRSED